MTTRTMGRWVALVTLAAAGPALAKEYALDEDAVSAKVDRIVITPITLEVGKKEVLTVVAFRNTSGEPVMMRLDEFRCMRGDTVVQPFADEEWIIVPAGASRKRTFVCKQAPETTGDYGLFVRRIVRSLGEKSPGEPIAEDITWRLPEADLERATSGVGLACVTYVRPAPLVPAGEPAAVCAGPCDCPVAVPPPAEAVPVAAGTEPAAAEPVVEPVAAEPVAAEPVAEPVPEAAPPPPPATLRPR